MLILQNISYFEMQSDTVMVTMASLALSISGLIILFDKCLPLNWYRATLITMMLIFSGLYLWLLGESISKLMFNELNTKNWLTIIGVVIIAMIIFKVVDICINKILKKHEKAN